MRFKSVICFSKAGVVHIEEQSLHHTIISNDRFLCETHK